LFLAAFALSVAAATPSMAMDDMHKPMKGMEMRHSHCMMKKEHRVMHGHMVTMMKKVCH